VVIPIDLIVLFIASSICLALAAGAGRSGPAAAIASIAAPIAGYRILQALRGRTRDGSRRHRPRRWTASPGAEGIIDAGPS
jgi:hypothetical protein